MLRSALTACLAAWVLATPAPARADAVALLDPDDALRDAVETVLVPWRIDVLVVAAPPPGPTMPSSAARARAIAAEHGVEAVVWISRDGDDFALWMYDADADDTVARRLPSGPPFDDETAAAVALSIKTLLRHSPVAPEPERYAAAVAPPRSPRSIRFEAAAGAGRAVGAADVEARLGLGLGWWPGAWRGRAGVAFTADAGAGASVRSERFAGRFTDRALRVAARARVGLGARLQLVPELGAALHATALDGVTLDPETDADETRWNPSLDAALAIQRRVVGDLHVGVRGRGGWNARRQRYLVLGEPVLSIPKTDWQALLYLELHLF